MDLSLLNEEPESTLRRREGLREESKLLRGWDIVA
jgi:hypothetical protein